MLEAGLLYWLEVWLLLKTETKRNTDEKNHAFVSVLLFHMEFFSTIGQTVW